MNTYLKFLPFPQLFTFTLYNILCKMSNPEEMVRQDFLFSWGKAVVIFLEHLKPAIKAVSSFPSFYGKLYTGSESVVSKTDCS